MQEGPRHLWGLYVVTLIVRRATTPLGFICCCVLSDNELNETRRAQLLLDTPWKIKASQNKVNETRPAQLHCGTPYTVALWHAVILPASCAEPYTVAMYPLYAPSETKFMPQASQNLRPKRTPARNYWSTMSNHKLTVIGTPVYHFPCSQMAISGSSSFILIYPVHLWDLTWSITRLCKKKRHLISILVKLVISGMYLSISK